MTIKHILVPTDFNPDSEAALHYAADLARQLGASIHLLHVVEDPLAAGMWSSTCYSSEIAGLQITLASDARKRLRLSIPRVAGSRVEFEHDVRIGSAARTIVEYASEHRADLVVMGTAGRTGLARFVMGSVAERVVRTAPCPVLTLRAGRESAVARETAVPVAASA